MSYEDIPPDVLEALISEYMASQGAAPMTVDQMSYAGAMPAFDLEGDPYTLTQQLNQLQDVNQLMADPVFQGGGGVGAWSPEAFQPTVAWEQVDSPEYRRWQNYINTPDSFEGMIAAEIAGGGTPYSAMRKIQQRVAEDPTGPLAQQLQLDFGQQDFELGGYLSDENGNPMIDWTKAAEAATKIDELRAEVPDIGPGTPLVAPDGTVIPGTGEIMEIMGPNGPQLVRRTETPSPLMEKFNELGFPSPFEEYTPEMFLGPEWSAEPYGEAVGNVDVMRQAMLDAYRDTVEPPKSPTGPRATPRQPEAEGEVPLADRSGSLVDVMRQNPSGDTGGFWNSIARQGLWDLATGNEGEGQPGGGPGLDAGEAVRTTGTLGGNALADAVLENPSGDTGGFWNSLARQGLWDLITGNEGEGEPAEARGFMGPAALGGALPAGAYSYEAPRDYQERVSGRTFWPTGDEEPAPPITDWGGGEFPPSETSEWVEQDMANPFAPDFQQQVRPSAAPQSAQEDPVRAARLQAQQDAMLAAILPSGLVPPYARQNAQQARQPGDVGTPGSQQPPPYLGDMSGNPFSIYFPPENYVGPPPQPEYNPLAPQEGGRRPPMGGNAAAGGPFNIVWRPENYAGPPPQPEYNPLAQTRPPSRRRTGEEGEAERQRLARERAPETQGERYEATTGALGGSTDREQVYGVARKMFRQAWLDALAAKQQTYGAEEGYARGLAAGLRERGITPYQQVVAQRMQNIQGAGIPLQSRPQVVGY